MNIRPLDYFENDELCRFELFGLANATMVPVMMTMTPTVGVQAQHAVHQPLPAPGILQTNAIPPPHLTPGIPLIPAKMSQEQLQKLATEGGGIVGGVISGGGSEIGGSVGVTGFIFQKLPSQLHPGAYGQHLHQQQLQHQQQQQTQPQTASQTQKFMETTAASCIPGFSIGNTTAGPGCKTLVTSGCGAGCNALMMMSIDSTGIVGGGGRGGGSSTSNTSHGEIPDNSEGTSIGNDQMKQFCNCAYMNFENFIEYQTTGFGGLPDVTEHSNIRRTTVTHQDSISNSESAEVASLQKSKKQIKNRNSKRTFCIFSLSLASTLVFCAIVSILVYQFFYAVPNRNSHDQRLKIVERILREVPLIDGHNNLAWNIRKYAHSSLELLDLTQELDHKTVWHRPVWSQTDIPRLKKGLVGAQIWSAFVPCEAQGLDAVQLALEQIDIIHRLTELHPKELALVVSSQEILNAHRRGMIASLIGVEGGHALGSSLGVLRSMHSLGARYLTLTHQCDTSWAGSSSMSMEKGLSSFGKAVVKEMNRLGMMIDLSQSSDATALDVLEVTRAPVIFSHSVARSLCNSTRNVPDDILRAVADNGGLIMVSFASEHVACDDTSTLQDVIAHIKYIRSIAGIQHIGIGAGYDGIESPPIGLEDVSKYPNLFAMLLEDPNWSEDDIAMLAGRNFLRVLKSVENVRDYWKRAAIPPIEIVEPIKKSQCTYMSS